MDLSYEEFSAICEQISEGKKLKEIFPDKDDRKAFQKYISRTVDAEKQLKRAEQLGEHWQKLGVPPTKQRLLQEGGVRYQYPSEDKTGAKEVRVRANQTCPLDYYRKHKVINRQMWIAGGRYADLCFNSGVFPRQISIYERDHIRSTAGDVDAFMATKTDAQKALDNIYPLLEPLEWDVLLEVCVHYQFAGKGARLRALKDALNKLVGYYELPSDKQSNKRPIQTLHQKS
ncbi:MAG: hypothetical protein CL561_00285 [Alphaproteobacteria bacterium]|nr:hypothetical protein [Alphaproteobacteria bacterium]|tara:strand:+ start:1855 stop:2544 length:690 start_codon:yes stop_codon:yes gene_type:complete